MADDKNRLRKTYSFFRQQPVYASGGGGGGTGGGDPDATYLVLSLTSSLSNERAFVASTGLKFVDGGANGNYTLSINDGTVATISGSTFTGVTTHASGLSGSLTRLADGTSYLVAGPNVTIVSASNGSVTISSTGGGGGSGDPNASYVVLSTTGSLSSERVLSAGTGLSLTDAGAGGNVTLSVNDSIVATVSGSTFTGAVKFNQGLSGSLTRLIDGSSYLAAGANVTITSASNGQVTISSSGGGTPAGSDTEIQFNNVGSFGASANLNFNSSTNRLSLTGSLGMKGDIVPDADTTYNLGTSDNRWANVYTGDLHLRNDRGDWTIVEERDYLCVVNNITGKKYKMMLQPLDNE